MHYPTDRIAHATAGTLVRARNSSIGSLRGIDPTTHRIMSGSSTTELNLAHSASDKTDRALLKQ